MEITIIVPIFNGARYLPAFFESLQVAMPQQSQLILIDDASTESVFDTIPEFPNASEVTRLRNDSNLGYAATVNRGFKEATGDYLVQLNTDLVLEKNCIRAMLDLISTRRNVGIVGSKLIFPTTGLIQHIGIGFGHFSFRHVFLGMPADHPLSCKTRSMTALTGATVAMTRSVLNSIGLLDEEFFNIHEDIDHCLKASERGFQNYTCAESIAYHWVSQSGPSRFARLRHGDALFWSRWGGKHKSDLTDYLRESINYLLEQSPDLQNVPFEIINLSRSRDDQFVLSELAQSFPNCSKDIRNYRQYNNPSSSLWLPMLLPHWMANDPKPFLYIVDSVLEITENRMWFESRMRIVKEEIVIDLYASVSLASEFASAL